MGLILRSREPNGVPDTDDPMFRQEIADAHERIDETNRNLENLELRLRVIERK